MADRGWAAEFHLSALRQIGEGGMRRVYLHPHRPGMVLKRFRDPPCQAYLEAIGDAAEFDAYLLGKARLREAVFADGERRWREPILEQPFCPDLRDALPLTVTYWELRREASDACCAADPSTAGRLALEIEPSGTALRSLCRSSAALANALTCMHERILAYSSRTGCALDFAGGGNVLVIADCRPRVEIIDGIKGDRLASRRWRPSARPELHETATLLNACAFFRAMFMIEALAGIAAPRRLVEHWLLCLTDLRRNRHRLNIDRLRDIHETLRSDFAMSAA